MVGGLIDTWLNGYLREGSKAVVYALHLLRGT